MNNVKGGCWLWSKNIWIMDILISVIEEFFIVEMEFNYIFFVNLLWLIILFFGW